MPKNHPPLTAERLRELLDYCPLTGQFRWKVRTGSKAPAGASAGTIRGKGYVYINVDKHGYMGHRLAWLHAHGRWPSDQIDHINGNRIDNALENLREATPAENQQNRKVNCNNTSRFQGVSWDKSHRRWQARICVNGRKIKLGRYRSAELAGAAYLDAKARLHTFQPSPRAVVDPAA